MLQNNNELLFFNKSIFKLVKLFFNNPDESFYLRKLAKLTKLSTTAVKKACGDLQKLNIILEKKTDLTTNYIANKKSRTYYDYKFLYNLFVLKTCGIIKELEEELKPQTIVVFGPYSRGIDDANNDINLFVVSSKNQKINMQKYESVLQRKINIYQVPSLKTSSKEFQNLIANGITLSGYIEIV